MSKSLGASEIVGRLDDQDRATLIDGRGIEKRFGAHLVVRDVTLACHPGEIVLLLGANGAGKSTLLRILAGLVRADRGGVRLAPGVKVGFSGHHTGLYSKLSVLANLRLYAELAGVEQGALQEILRLWQLDQVQHKEISEVSRGAQSKASLIRALMNQPEVLLLDEPSSNLDDRSTELLLKEVSLRAEAGSAVLLATHDLARIASVANRVVVMEQGNIVADSRAETDRSAIDSVIERYRSINR
jgi:ABC-type multidrug transport system ATPase subunit